MPYICLHCAKEVKNLEKFIRCPYCGYRVLAKRRSSLAKSVPTD